jgi:hypothetical protein
MVGYIHHVEPTRITRIGVKYTAALVLIKRTYSWSLFTRKFAISIIVVHSSLLQLLRRKRYVKIIVENILEGGDPLETPPHPLLERLQLFQWGPRNGNHHVDFCVHF